MNIKGGVWMEGQQEGGGQEQRMINVNINKVMLHACMKINNETPL
jgi:hypothetical protein